MAHLSTFLIKSTFPRPPGLASTASHWLQLLQSCGWARSERIPDLALQQMCQAPRLCATVMQVVNAGVH
jgi:hypothetical protein